MPGHLRLWGGRIKDSKRGQFAMTKIVALCAAALAAALIVRAAPPAMAQDVLTAHRLSAALAAEAVAEAVASCAKQGYKVTAAIVDDDGVVQAMLRGDVASMTTPKSARDKAYTALMLGGSRNEDQAQPSCSGSATHPPPATWRS